MISTIQKEEHLSKSLPIISTQTVDAVFHVYGGKKWGKHLEEVRDRLLQENPQLVKFIESQVGKYPPAIHNALFEAIMGTLSVLEHQAMFDSKETSRSMSKRHRQRQRGDSAAH